MTRAEDSRQREVDRRNQDIVRLQRIGAAYPHSTYVGDITKTAIELAILKREVIAASPIWFWWLIDALEDWLTEVRKVCHL